MANIYQHNYVCKDYVLANVPCDESERVFAGLLISHGETSKELHEALMYIETISPNYNYNPDRVAEVFNNAIIYDDMCGYVRDHYLPDCNICNVCSCSGHYMNANSGMERRVILTLLHTGAKYITRFCPEDEASQKAFEERFTAYIDLDEGKRNTKAKPLYVQIYRLMYRMICTLIRSGDAPRKDEIGSVGEEVLLSKWNEANHRYAINEYLLEEYPNARDIFNNNIRYLLTKNGKLYLTSEELDAFFNGEEKKEEAVVIPFRKEDAPVSAAEIPAEVVTQEPSTEAASDAVLQVPATDSPGQEPEKEPEQETVIEPEQSVEAEVEDEPTEYIDGQTEYEILTQLFNSDDPLAEDDEPVNDQADEGDGEGAEESEYDITKDSDFFALPEGDTEAVSPDPEHSGSISVEPLVPEDASAPVNDTGEEVPDTEGTSDDDPVIGADDLILSDEDFYYGGIEQNEAAAEALPETQEEEPSENADEEEEQATSQSGGPAEAEQKEEPVTAETEHAAEEEPAEEKRTEPAPKKPAPLATPDFRLFSLGKISRDFAFKYMLPESDRRREQFATALVNASAWNSNVAIEAVHVADTSEDGFLVWPSPFKAPVFVPMSDAEGMRMLKGIIKDAGCKKVTSYTIPIYFLCAQHHITIRNLVAAADYHTGRPGPEDGYDRMMQYKDNMVAVTAPEDSELRYLERAYAHFLYPRAGIYTAPVFTYVCGRGFVFSDYPADNTHLYMNVNVRNVSGEEWKLSVEDLMITLEKHLSFEKHSARLCYLDPLRQLMVFEVERRDARAFSSVIGRQFLKILELKCVDIPTCILTQNSHFLRSKR